MRTALRLRRAGWLPSNSPPELRPGAVCTRRVALALPSGHDADASSPRHRAGVPIGSGGSAASTSNCTLTRNWPLWPRKSQGGRPTAQDYKPAILTAGWPREVTIFHQAQKRCGRLAQREALRFRHNRNVGGHGHGRESRSCALRQPAFPNCGKFIRRRRS